MPKKVVSTQRAPEAVGPYAQAVRAGNLVFISGQIGIDPDTGRLRGGGFEEEARQVLANLGAILTAGGLGAPDILKTTVFLTSLEDFPALNELYGDWVGAEPPARSTVQVAALPLGAQVEIEAVAWAGG